MEFINGTQLGFIDISSEEWREYRFPGNETIRLIAPLYLNVSTGGGHRVFTPDGVSHYVPIGWLHLRWGTKEGAPHFVK